MKTIVKKGWAGKCDDDVLFKQDAARGISFWNTNIATSRATKDFWALGDWPPRRVTITVEVED